MMAAFKYYLKSLLVKIGARFPRGALFNLLMVVNYMRLGRWMADHGFSFPELHRERNRVFDSVIARVKDKKILYLEFGVFTGEVTSYWSRALTHPETVMHGFDSFEGLPEHFDVEGPNVMGHFDVGGRIPKIDDPRVRYFKGWFDRTLPAYQVPPHDTMVLILDADLYSSTIYVLNFLASHIKPGDYIFFDDLSRVEHEARAFDEFMRNTGKKFAPVCAESTLNRAFFQCIG